MRISELIEHINSKQTYAARIQEARDRYAATNNQMVKDAIDKYLQDTEDYCVGLIQRVKDGEEFAFDELIKIRDIRNFIYYYSHQIEKYHLYRYKHKDVVAEMRLQIFHHIKFNYRIYNEPTEFSLLINSMRKWIKQKVSAALKDTYKPKMDDYLPELSIQDESYDHTEKQVLELAEELLDGECLAVFKLKMFEDKTLEQISKVVGKSIDTCKRRYDKALLIIKEHIEKPDSGYIK